jgi:hypothetical protein
MQALSEPVTFKKSKTHKVKTKSKKPIQKINLAPKPLQHNAGTTTVQMTMSRQNSVKSQPPDLRDAR